MTSLFKFFVILALSLMLPATFLGCGPSYMSVEEASKNEESDTAGMQDMDDEDADDSSEDDSGFSDQ